MVQSVCHFLRIASDEMVTYTGVYGTHERPGTAPLSFTIYLNILVAEGYFTLEYFSKWLLKLMSVSWKDKQRRKCVDNSLGQTCSKGNT